jgi:hypothetical protein
VVLSSAQRMIASGSVVQPGAKTSAKRSGSGGDDRWSQIVDRGTIRMAIAPDLIGQNFEVNGEMVGTEREIASLVCRELGVQPEFVTGDWIDLPKLVVRGAADVMFHGLIPDASYTGLTYSRAYLDGGLVILRRADDTSIRSLADLEGKRVGICADPAARQVLENSGFRFKEICEVVDLEGDFVRPLAQGLYDGFVIDTMIGWTICHLESSPNYRKLVVAGDPLCQWIFSAGLKDHPSNAELLRRMDHAIGVVRAGAQYRQVVERWQGRVFNWGKSPADFLPAA